MKDTRDPDVLAALARELGRKNRFRSAREGAVLAILRAAGLLRRALAARFEAEGLTMAQYNVLRILRGAPEGLPTLQIRRRMVEEGAGITRLVDKLETIGLIERDRPGSDRRQVLCRITRKGLDLLEQTDARLADAHAEMLHGLSAGEATQLAGLLLQAIDSVRENGQRSGYTRQTQRNEAKGRDRTVSP
jgi:DNA-binding MarR family transcriptional regulator